MAQELVLIPKTKYDHLLQQVQNQKTEIDPMQNSSVKDNHSLSQVDDIKLGHQQQGGQSEKTENNMESTDLSSKVK